MLFRVSRKNVLLLRQNGLDTLSSDIVFKSIIPSSVNLYFVEGDVEIRDVSLQSVLIPMLDRYIVL